VTAVLGSTGAFLFFFAKWKEQQLDVEGMCIYRGIYRDAAEDSRSGLGYVVEHVHMYECNVCMQSMAPSNCRPRRWRICRS